MSLIPDPRSFRVRSLRLPRLGSLGFAVGPGSRQPTRARRERSARGVPRAVATGAILGLIVLAPYAHASYLATVDQAGTDVTVNGAGSINTSALSFVINGTNFSPFIQPTMGTILLGQTGPNNVSIYGGISGPSSFGAGPQSLPSSGSGPIVGVQHIGMTGLLILPNGYLSGVTLGTSIDTYTRCPPPRG